MKIFKNGDFLHISGIFGHKKNFPNNRTRPCFEDIANFCAKIQKKLMMKSRENAKKPVFRQISGNYSRENLIKFYILPFCISMQNFMK